MANLSVLLAGWMILLAISCRMVGDTNLSDEGFTSTEDRSIAEIVDRMVEIYGAERLDSSTQEALLKHLPLTLQATFYLECVDNLGISSSGSGVFTSNNGHFVTAAHVINVDTQNCDVTTQSLNDKGRLVRNNFSTDIDVRIGRIEGSYDIAYGWMESYKHPHFMNVDKSLEASPGRVTKVIAAGYPGMTLRKPDAEEHIKAAYETVNFDLVCQGRSEEILYAHAIGDRLVGTILQIAKNVNANEYEVEYQMLLAKYCDYYKSQMGKGFVSDFDIPSGAHEAPFVAFGEQLGTWKNALFTSLDIMHGMSGGPIINLGDGSLVGVVSKHFATDTTGTGVAPAAIGRVGITVGARVSKDQLNQLKKEGQEDIDVCACKVEMREDDYFDDTVHFRKNMLLCLPDGVEPKNKFCKQLSHVRATVGRSTRDYELYYQVTSCAPILTVRAPGCFIKPGNKVRAYRNGRYLGRYQSSMSKEEMLLILSGLEAEQITRYVEGAKANLLGYQNRLP